MEYLPREIIIDILSRLPVTSLLQFTLVCKAWHKLIQDPLLVSMHFLRTTNNDPCLILHRNYPIQNQLYSFELSGLGKEDKRVNKIRTPVLPAFEVVGSCKGLLCLCESSGKDILYVYNPFTRDCIELPKFRELLHLSPVFGFGFSHTTNKYKVVKIVYGKTPPGPRNQQWELLFYQAEVQILTLGNPAWRNIGKLPYHIYQEPSQVLVCGRIHWRSGARGFRPGFSIISFDLEDEQFQEVPKPDCGGLNKRYIHLVKLGGCLSAAVCDNCDQIEIWIMKEYNVKESWIKEFNIGNHVPRSLEEAFRDPSQPFIDLLLHPKHAFVRVLGLLKTGEVLLEYKCRALVTYDKKDGTFKILTFPGLRNWFQTVVHEGSLNWIDSIINDA